MGSIQWGCNKSKSKVSDANANTLSDLAAAAADGLDVARARARRLAEDDQDPSLDVGPNNRPLFTTTSSLSLLTRKDACTYFKFSEEEFNVALPEGLRIKGLCSRSSISVSLQGSPSPAVTTSEGWCHLVPWLCSHHLLMKHSLELKLLMMFLLVHSFPLFRLPYQLLT